MPVPTPATPAPLPFPAFDPESRRAPRDGKTLLRVALSVYILTAVPRVHEILPVLGPLRPAKLALVVILLSGFYALRSTDFKRVLRTRMAKCVLLIAFLACASVFTSVWPGNSVKFLLNSYPPILALFFLGGAAMCDRVTLRYCLVALTFGLGLASAAMLAGIEQVAGRAMVGGLDPNDAAALLVSTLPFVLLLAQSSKGVRRIGMLIMGLAMVAALVKTGSRGGAVGLAAVAGAMVLLASKRDRRNYLVVLVLGATVFGFVARGELAERYTSLFSLGEDYNVTDPEGRVAVAKRGISYMMRRPVFGVGVDGFETAEGVLSGKTNEGYGLRYTAAHNMYVQIGAETGVLGLLAFFTMLGSGLIALNRARRTAARAGKVPTAVSEEALARATLIGLLGVCVTGAFLSLAYHPLLYLQLTLTVAVVAASPSRRSLAAGAPVRETPRRPAPAVVAPWRSAWPLPPAPRLR